MVDTIGKQLMQLQSELGLMVTQKSDKEFLLVKTVADRHWWDIFGKGSRKIVFSARVLIERDRKTLRYIPQLKEKNVTMGAVGAGFATSKTRGRLIDTKIRERRLGIQESGRPGEILNVKFDPGKIRERVQRIARRNRLGFSG